MRKASVGVLAFVGIAVLLVSFLSTNLGYRGAYDIAGMSVQKVADGRPGIESGLRGIRGTSAAFAAAFAVLWLGIVFGPYKRGDVGAWWTLAASILILNVLILLRIPTLGTKLGAATGLTLLVLSSIGLLLDAGRLKAPAA